MLSDIAGRLWPGVPAQPPVQENGLWLTGAAAVDHGDRLVDSLWVPLYWREVYFRKKGWVDVGQQLSEPDLGEVRGLTFSFA